MSATQPKDGLQRAMDATVRDDAKRRRHQERAQKQVQNQGFPHDMNDQEFEDFASREIAKGLFSGTYESTVGYIIHLAHWRGDVGQRGKHNDAGEAAD